ncbi:hypothetical protein H4V97_000432 [Flavobacterium sp. CG_23.5]|uniref:DUF2442 domain-containing protein n=1 Tax=unclassified Flavobacterium TaxID=196869 RepID=UPI0018CB670F|nr:MULTISPECIES: DUF2442 domain-containing protein [unclassified Flavobacterium]MBG6111327.1 hypothetical protein [Flavobacterium sp. CG_9.10]MBP2282114.1 hypothetical protein [Flavobacterium sp. CG_23.5]
MKIAVNYSNQSETEAINVVAATYVNGYVIKVTFTDASEKNVDFELFLSKSQHPSISKYLDLNNFKNFTIVYGNLNWNDYDMIFPIWDLYEGKIS